MVQLTRITELHSLSLMRSSACSPIHHCYCPVASSWSWHGGSSSVALCLRMTWGYAGEGGEIEFTRIPNLAILISYLLTYLANHFTKQATHIFIIFLDEKILYKWSFASKARITSGSHNFESLKLPRKNFKASLTRRLIHKLMFTGTKNELYVH